MIVLAMVVHAVLGVAGFDEGSCIAFADCSS